MKRFKQYLKEKNNLNNSKDIEKHIELYKEYEDTILKKVHNERKKELLKTPPR